MLVGGLLGLLFLKASGLKLGKTQEWVDKNSYLEFNELVGKAKKVLRKFPKKIVLPLDVAVDVNGKRRCVRVSDLPSEFLIKDIGDKTIELFSEKLHKAKSIMWNGTMGVYEEKAFMKGTKAMAKALIKSKAYDVIGGGDTEVATERAGFSSETFSHASLAGKAFLQYLSGKPVPGLEALKQ